LRTKAQIDAAVDRKESEKVKQRSNGVCERCDRQRAVHVHHMVGGRGRRGRGVSALAQNKVHLCAGCHEAIHMGRA